MKTSRKRILKLEVNLISQNELIYVLTHKKIRESFGYVCFGNVHMCIETYRDLRIRKAINNADYILTDGIPLVFTLRLLYGIKQERIAGMDFMPAMMAVAEKNRESVFFYGSTDRVIKNIIKRAKLDFPELKIAGFISPPFHDTSVNDINDHVKIINSSNARYIFVGLGCPKQELWMSANHEKINGILFGVGAAFEVYSRDKKIAPEWIRRIGMEWFFRFIQEPRRLFQRYLISNSFFIILILIELFKVRILRVHGIGEQ